MICRVVAPAVALETTLLMHGVPAAEAMPLARDLARIVRAARANPAVVGVLRGEAVVGMTDAELEAMLAEGGVPKVNTSNLGLMLHQGRSAATTVSATMELAAAAGVRVFATGGIGGVHRGFGSHWDVSADLLALARFPVAVVASGVKSLLDVESTREMLETLGVPVVGFRTDSFPAFYVRRSAARVDARFDDARELARFVAVELARTGRGVLVANPVNEADAIEPEQMEEWLALAEAQVGSGADTQVGKGGRDATPSILRALHDLSGGQTLRTNLALVRGNAALSADLARAMHAD
ncbi:MAG: pseudouridine-5'-phosphate glycosidase [Phycisphaerales bacterium]